ncbi:hypothetical protein D3OALGA1CA_5547 [Olavius algarvensis associated proteobacterium Delta 3]|nr:hypothetical protein D3OALGB2SA_5104 [Olavius algarvensis associated proteobacterium Delta 3]CAB5168347.1 hypothetical protein D3OALGA1CA_5547 [Olavius algarvensis associated proteobacterium Delta 3]
MSICQPRIEERQIDVAIIGDGNSRVAIDPSLVEQAIVNLLDNAIKYSDNAGRIEIDVNSGDSELVISVKDNGIGISNDHLPRLFERFYRVDQARSRALGGTGLGLSIVKHILQAHGGRVSVESLPGIGSTFRIHLPNNGV